MRGWSGASGCELSKGKDLIPKNSQKAAKLNVSDKVTMAKGKKKSVASGGPHKKHGPKKKLHHCWSSTMRWHFAKAGLLTKEHDFESWQTACAARGKKNVSKNDFIEFHKLSADDKKKYFENLVK